MAKKKDKDFKEIVELFIKDIKTQRKYTDKTLENYRSWLKAVHNWSNEKSIDWIKDALISAESYPIEKIGGKYDANKGKIKVGKNHKCIYMMFAKWLAGQYHANVWLSIDKSSDLEFCKLIAKNALFCTCDVADAVKSGKKGGDINLKKGGNTYYSWYFCKYRRKKCKEEVGKVVGKNFNYEEIIADNNNYANFAIKAAVKASLPPLGVNFKDYEACHIWDLTCYDYRYYTSVFNLVLVPRSIAGLTDHNEAVKQMLQYESARRFGVYPDKKQYGDCPKKPSNFDKIKIWRQQKEHEDAIFDEETFTELK